MKKTWAIIAMLAAMGCVSCDDDSDENVQPCVENSRMCSADGSLAVCVKGEYVKTPCGANMFCSDKLNRCVECVDGQQAPMCDQATNSVKYCSDGMWKYTACNNGKCTDTRVDATNQLVQVAAYCKNDSASGTECTVGAKRCTVSGQAQVCGADGRWGTPVNCNNGTTCQSGECKADAVCTANAVKCNGTGSVQKCIDNTWQTVETCNVAAGQECNATSGTCESVWVDCPSDCMAELKDGTTLGCVEACQQAYNTSECHLKETTGQIACGELSGSTSDEPWECGDLNYDDAGTVTLAQYCAQSVGAGTVAICDYDENGKGVFDCYEPCTTNGSRKTSCDVYTSYGAVEMNVICDDYAGLKVYVPDYDSAKQCPSKACNAEKTACGEGGSEPVTSGDFHRCKEYDSYCSGDLCVYDDGDTADNGYCAAKCSSAGAGKKSCEQTQSGGYAVFYMICAEADGELVYADVDYDKSYRCDNGCNEAGDDCASGGGTPSSGNSFGYFDCSGYQMADAAGNPVSISDYCKSEKAGSVGVCTGQSMVGCLSTCSASDASSHKTVNTCREYQDGDYLDVDECMQLNDSSIYVYAPGDSYTACTNGCNASHTACK